VSVRRGVREILRRLIRTSERIYSQGWVNKDHHVLLSLLVNHENTPAKPVRCGPEAGLGVQILRPALSEVLVSDSKLAGRESLTSARCHYDAHSASLSSTNQPGLPLTVVNVQRSRELRKCLTSQNPFYLLLWIRPETLEGEATTTGRLLLSDGRSFTYGLL
jgi:hypothetical protein